MAKSKKDSWIVTMECTITKRVICEECTEEQAMDEPFNHAIDEQEIEQIDYKVKSVIPND